MADYGLNRWDVENLVRHANSCGALIKGRYVPARPIGLFNIQHRIKMAWAVFKGRADVVFWPGQGDGNG